MALGYDRPLYILAMDHRGTLERGIFGLTTAPTKDEIARIVQAKHVIYDGVHAAVDAGVAKDEAGILVDEQYGATIAREAVARGELLAMTVEKSGGSELQFEYGDAFGSHLDEFNVTFGKVLVRYNPDGDAALNARQAALLKKLADYLHNSGRKLLLEVVIPGTSGQLATVNGDLYRYDTEIRPDLTVRMIEQLQAAGIETDIWKIEGLDRRADCIRVAAQARSGGRDRVGCVVLGRAADLPRVEHWLREAAGVPGYVGFAIGRTLWWDAIKEYVAGNLDHAGATARIAASYRGAVETYVAAVRLNAAS
jgi:myo-inositol catabolism protein IolC